MSYRHAMPTRQLASAALMLTGFTAGITTAGLTWGAKGFALATSAACIVVGYMIDEPDAPEALNTAPDAPRRQDSRSIPVP